MGSTLLAAYVTVFSAVLGLIMGSFATVLAHRIPDGRSIVMPPSACDACGERLRVRDNIPVFSWLVLRGRCARCAAHIPVRYPLIEATTALLFAMLTWHLGLVAALPSFLALAVVGVALADIDLRLHRLPNALTLPMYPASLVLLAIAAAWDGAWDAYGRAVIGMLVALLVYAGLAWFRPDAMGLGDVKLSGVLGLHLAWLGWGALVIGLFAAFALGAVVGVALMAVRRAGRRTAIPFGPFMLAGALVGILVGEPLWQSYLVLVMG